MENEIDPENNFFYNIQINCEYYTDEQFNVKVKMDGAVSIIHFNSRSLNSNFSKIKQCLQQIEQKMTVIAISETWLIDDQAVMYEIEGYEMFFVNRREKREGELLCTLTLTTGAELWKICRLLKTKLWSVLL